MKCDNLEAEQWLDYSGEPRRCYPADKVDEAIAELKAENERLNKELEHVKNGDCINTCDVLEKHGKELVSTKRSLWLARAKMANERQRYECECRSDGWVHREIRWVEVERLCIKKAEEYK